MISDYEAQELRPTWDYSSLMKLWRILKLCAKQDLCGPRKGKIFMEMGRNTDALLQYHRCLTLDPEFTAAREEIQKILQGHALPLPDTVEGLLSAVSVYTTPMKRDNIQFLKNRKYNRTFLLEEIMSKLFPIQLEERKQVHDLEMAELSKKYNRTFLLEEIMSKLFPIQLEERKQVHDLEMAELSNLTKDIPIFVCTMAYPGVPCLLHVFEPRYRLMMRRCMETGTKKFGMCTYEHGKGFADYGCMLEILGLDVLPDGRSYVDCIGRSRFRVLKRSHRDGYHTADIEYLEDQKVEGADLEVLKCLHDGVFQQAHDWFHRLTGRIQGQISMQHGLMPDKEEDIQVTQSLIKSSSTSFSVITKVTA
ncbi:UNVERIFIED_CONTAM: hypothetical protein FKN15_043005 [Acipenser sinensis]